MKDHLPWNGNAYVYITCQNPAKQKLLGVCTFIAQIKGTVELA